VGPVGRHYTTIRPAPSMIVRWGARWCDHKAILSVAIDRLSVTMTASGISNICAFAGGSIACDRQQPEYVTQF